MAARRLAQNRREKVRTTLYVGDTETASGVAVTATATRDYDGSVAQASTAAALVGGSVGTYELALSPAACSTLGPITVAWAVTLEGVAQVFETKHEVVGAHYFEAGSLRQLDPLDDAAKYPIDWLDLARDLASDALEDACHTAFVPRANRHVGADAGRPPSELLALPHGRLRSITSASVDGTALGVDDLAAIRTGQGGLLQRLGKWGTERGSGLSLVYAYGYDRPPLRIYNAARLLSRQYAERRRDVGAPDRATFIDNDAGTFRLLTAGEDGNLFDIPEVNAAVAEYVE